MQRWITALSTIPQPAATRTDSVTLTVADGLGHTDRVHFIFNQGGSGP